jgi:hypothetical protein
VKRQNLYDISTVCQNTDTHKRLVTDERLVEAMPKQFSQGEAESNGGVGLTQDISERNIYQVFHSEILFHSNPSINLFDRFAVRVQQYFVLSRKIR